MATFTCYADVPDVLTNGTINVETASLVTGNGTLSGGGCLAGATTINLNAGSAFATSGTFTAWFTDGPQSESVAGASYAGNVVTLPAPGTVYAHAGGVSVSSAGTQGCLASVIARASATLENVCKQGPDGGGDRTLYRKARTDVLSGPNAFRAAFDEVGTLILRPYHFPITAVSAVTVQMGAGQALTLDTTFLTLPDNARRLEIPLAQITGSPPATVSWLGYRFPRDVAFYATLAYTAGPIAGTTLDGVPSDIREALYLLVTDTLARRENPIGAAMYKLGDRMFEARLRGDTSGKSLLRLQAEDMLRPYSAGYPYGG